jgi:SOS regulatory protein LexA
MELDAVQRRLIKSKVILYSILKGAKGSGKTTAAVYRIIYLENNYCIYEQDKILIVAHSEEVLSKIKYLHKALDNESMMDYRTLFSNAEDKLYLFTVDNIINKYFLEFKKDNNLSMEVIYDDHSKAVIINECIHANKELYPDMKILDDKYVDFFVHEISWMKSCNYLELNSYQNADRIGRICKKGMGPQRLLKNSRAREVIFSVMLLYNEALIKNNLIDNEDKALLALKQAQKSNMVSYTHIVIGETQKLTKVQLELINALKNTRTYSNVIFILDDEGTANCNAWFIKGRRGGKLELQSKPKNYCFRQNYRTSEKSIESAHQDTVENFSYYDLRHRKSFEFIRDENNISDVLLSDKDGGSEYTKDELRELPIYNNIAAGEPILMNPEVAGNFYIPKLWLKGMKDCFILKVKGDSMINADINDGDYVIIRQQPFAQNNDIVAADIDGSATLKRLKMGKDCVVLMPENEKYKPIPVNDEGVRIIGTAVGVLKKS